MFKILFKTLFLSLWTAALSAQPAATDFTVTDSKGNQHRLYADYLDQGKTVVIEIFFTTCPPCNQIAPRLETLYQELGAGQQQVQMLALSNKTFDNDDDIETYKNKYGHTFPGAGFDGGSITALQAYQNGTFGVFFGTPTFIVIGPDKKVQYNVRGNTDAATIDSIKAAVARTTPAQTFTASGRVETADGQGVAGISVGIEGMEINPVLTDSNGHFALTFPVGPDTLYDLALQLNAAAAAGISTLDLVQIRRHILRIQSLPSPIALLAADVNRSGHLSAADLVAITRVILRIDSQFASVPNWNFLDVDFVNAHPDDLYEAIIENPNAGKPVINLQEAGAIRIIAFKSGDADLSAK